MIQYTLLNEKDVTTILSQYSSEKLVSFKVLSGGSANTNYLISTEIDSYVLTICELKTEKETIELASLLEYLQLNQFSTSKLIKTITGDLISHWNKKPILLKDFIKGDIVEEIPANLFHYLGTQLAQLHQIKAPDYLPRKVAFGIDHFDEVQIYAPDSDFYKWLKQTQNYIENHIAVDLPKALIHTDIFYSNIIIDMEANRASIMDFEEACYYYRVFDIGMMIIGTCRDNETLNLNKVSSLLDGYQQEIKLLEIEKKALKAFTVYAATATGFWRHQNYNYVNINPEMKDHYLEMQLLADSIMKMPDDCFI
ncbi:phosphotransferase [Flavobacterium sp. K5-23]|uniref:phosphotransferase n=1 Tax=Flavobacterium sp. K5-23 TaxID=2746225 RepID=UPI00200DE1D5|nr:phosphotransferase [Flavobacterium sp. K5-23]UQD56995.1 phosphotransferase [Flavobacterium sp. K5-23]